MRFLFNLLSNRPDEQWTAYWIRRDWKDYMKFMAYAKAHRLYDVERHYDEQQFLSQIATEYLGIKYYTDIKYMIWLRT